MFSQSLRSYTYTMLILKIALVFGEESMLDNSTPTVTQTHRSATNESKISRNRSSAEGEWRANDSSTDIHSASKIHYDDMTKFHKLRRNGLGNSPDVRDNFKRYFHVPVLPQHHFLGGGFESDLHHHHHQLQYQQDDRNRYNDEIYPVRVQNCGQYLRDDNRFQNEASSYTNQGIVPGWIGGKSRWRDKNNDNDDKRHESSTPTYVPITTATAKVPTSFNRYPDNNSPDKNYNNYHKPTHIPVKSRLSDSEYRPEDSSRPYYMSERDREYHNERNSPWTLPNPDRNNRIIYYEYNLEDLRRPRPNDPLSSFYSRDYGRRPNNCGLSDSEFVPCDQSEFHTGSKPFGRLPYDTLHSGPYAPVRSRSLSTIDTDEDNIRTPFLGDSHFGKETHYRLRHPDQGRRPNTNEEYTAGYAYSLDLPRDRQRIPGMITPFPFARSQFLNDESKYES